MPRQTVMIGSDILVSQTALWQYQALLFHACHRDCYNINVLLYLRIIAKRKKKSGRNCMKEVKLSLFCCHWYQIANK